MARNELYSIQMGHEEKPAYTCGHCSNIVVLRADRIRPRKTCYQCGRWVCETREICNIDCTPIHQMAKDRFENVGTRGKWIPAIMKGIDTVAEAAEQKLIF